MRAISRLIFITSLALAGLSMSAYGVALAAPGLPVNGLVRTLSLGQFSATSAVSDTIPDTAPATDAPEVTETPEPGESPHVTESPEAKESSEAAEKPEAIESPDLHNSDSQEQNNSRGTNTGRDAGGSNSGDENGAQGGGDGYQPLSAGWTALLMMDPRTGA